MLAKHAEMEQHVAVDVVADQEAEAARRVEPFHPAGNRRQLGRIHLQAMLPWATLAGDTSGGLSPVS